MDPFPDILRLFLVVVVGVAAPPFRGLRLYLGVPSDPSSERLADVAICTIGVSPRTKDRLMIKSRMY